MIRVGFLYTRLALNGLLALVLFETENGSMKSITQ